MTDNRIIIDGVDVSGCECLKYDKIGCDIDDCYCNGCDCHYKQLQREKNLNKVNLQRSIDLNQELNNIQGQLYCKEIELQQAKSECLKLELQKFEFEKQCEELREKYKWYEHYKEAALYNKNLCDKKSDEIAYYKQKLKKIKKIVVDMSSYSAQEERQIKQILSICEVASDGK